MVLVKAIDHGTGVEYQRGTQFDGIARRGNAIHLWAPGSDEAGSVIHRS